ncbi:MAG: bifunctional nuclease family protein [Thermomicrobiales bacterium]|nr:bifunctional nuclease family protein [Thermomicrobiales bacterium]
MQTLDDDDLVIAARAGDQEALAQLLTRHRPHLLAVCRHALDDAGLAEDAAQAACLQAFLGPEQLRDPARFGAWLIGIGLNCCHRLRRQNLREAWSWEALTGGSSVPESVDVDPGPAATVEAAELRAGIEAAVERLPRQQAAVRPHYLAGLTQWEAADLLGVTPGAVKTRLHNARSRLQRDLAPHASAWLALETRGVRMDLVELDVVDVRRRQLEDTPEFRYFVMLQERGGDRLLPIWIGAFEATAMALALRQSPSARPLTYAFAAELIRAANGQVREVRIDRLEENVFYATVVAGPAGERRVDARPSDALNLVWCSTPRSAPHQRSWR